jgi:hypothetical protein
MVWLALGQIFGFAGLTAWPPVITFSRRSRKFIEFDELRLVLISLFFIPGIAVWVLVAKMIMEDGICKIM